MKEKSPFISSLLISTCLITLVSCGSDSSGGGGTSSTRNEEQLGDEGIYRAVLKPINESLSGKTDGTVEVKIKGDDVQVLSNITGSPAGVKHLQNIMHSTSCPTAAVDANNDSLIDAAEAMKAAGKILIPLDSDLSSQLDGMSYGPISNGSGNYVYKKSTTLSSLLSDLNAVDPDPSDAVIKLPSGRDLHLAGRVVLIHGVRSSSDLPASVVAFGEHSAEVSLPIACGVLVRVRNEGVQPVPQPETDNTSNQIFLFQRDNM